MRAWSCVRAPERGGKPGFYVAVSRPFIAESDDVSTIICAPVYSQILRSQGATSDRPAAVAVRLALDRPRSKLNRSLSRSEIIQDAIRDYLAKRTNQEREARERRILGAHRDALARQAEALVAEQAAGVRIVQARLPLDRHGQGPAVLEVDDEGVSHKLRRSQRPGRDLLKRRV